MAVLKIPLTPEPAVVCDDARVESGLAAITSEGRIKSQFWFENASTVRAQRHIIETIGQLADILVALLTPAALVALVFGVWRIGTDLGWAGAFLISDGLFSHWQVWIALAIGLKTLSSLLIAWGLRTVKFSEEN